MYLLLHVFIYLYLYYKQILVKLQLFTGYILKPHAFLSMKISPWISPRAYYYFLGKSPQNCGVKYALEFILNRSG